MHDQRTAASGHDSRSRRSGKRYIPLKLLQYCDEYLKKLSYTVYWSNLLYSFLTGVFLKLE
jgi:hypothetical protein